MFKRLKEMLLESSTYAGLFGGSTLFGLLLSPEFKLAFVEVLGMGNVFLASTIAFFGGVASLLSIFAKEKKGVTK